MVPPGAASSVRWDGCVPAHPVTPAGMLPVPVTTSSRSGYRHGGWRLARVERIPFPRNTAWPDARKAMRWLRPHRRPRPPFPTGRGPAARLPNGGHVFRVWTRSTWGCPAPASVVSDRDSGTSPVTSRAGRKGYEGSMVDGTPQPGPSYVLVVFLPYRPGDSHRRAPGPAPVVRQLPG